VSLRAAVLCFPLLLLGACAGEGPTEVPTEVAPLTLAAKVTKVSDQFGTQIVDGKTGPGSLYRLSKPANWNGRLIVYTHGYVGPTLPVVLPSDGESFRQAFNAAGFAFAYSSYSENGYAIKDGIQRTHQLKGLFRAQFGVPAKTYIMGASLGGIIATALAEKYPGDYAGAMPMCGLIGGSQAQLDYIANTRIVFDALFPDLLPGDALGVPDNVNFATQVGPQLGFYFATTPSAGPRLAALASFDQTPIAYNDAGELGLSVIQALGFQFVGIGDILDRTNGNSPIDNAETVYSSPVGAFAPFVGLVNATAQRVTTTPSARNYVNRYYTPTGNLTVPVLTLHTTRDPIVPFFHEALYAETVAGKGKSDLLVQRSFERFGHCTFAPQEVAQGMQQLVAWAEFGLKPTP
jgi:pimeloyl-ACP methyl ester carboxylesterase